MFVLAFFIAIFGSEQMTTSEGIAVNIAHQLLSLACGYTHGCRKFRQQALRQPGFEVLPKKGSGEDLKSQEL